MCVFFSQIFRLAEYEVFMFLGGNLNCMSGDMRALFCLVIANMTRFFTVRCGLVLYHHFNGLALKPFLLSMICALSAYLTYILPLYPVTLILFLFISLNVSNDRTEI